MTPRVSEGCIQGILVVMTLYLIALCIYGLFG